MARIFDRIVSVLTFTAIGLFLYGWVVDDTKVKVISGAFITIVIFIYLASATCKCLSDWFSRRWDKMGIEDDDE